MDIDYRKWDKLIMDDSDDDDLSISKPSQKDLADDAFDREEYNTAVDLYMCVIRDDKFSGDVIACKMNVVACHLKLSHWSTALKMIEAILSTRKISLHDMIRCKYFKAVCLSKDERTIEKSLDEIEEVMKLVEKNQSTTTVSDKEKTDYENLHTHINSGLRLNLQIKKQQLEDLIKMQNFAGAWNLLEIHWKEIIRIYHNSELLYWYQQRGQILLAVNRRSDVSHLSIY